MTTTTSPAHENHIADLYAVLAEENWERCVLPSSGSGSCSNTSPCTIFQYAGGSEYDRITICDDNQGSYTVVIPLPTTTGAYRVQIQSAMDVYKYVDSFIEYYAEYSK